MEQRIANKFDKEGISYLYESEKFEYFLACKYTPDFFLPSGVIIEAKGFFKPSNRRLMLAVKQQHPELDIRFVFQRNNTISKTSTTTYGDWATRHGFPWCIYPHIPPDWFN